MRQLVGVVVTACAAAILGLALSMTPSPAGLGTHAQLNLPPCGWIVWADMPCPTCGMTTAFAHAVRGNMVASFLAQPLGFLLAIATAIALLVGLYVATTGSRIGSALGRLCNRTTVWLVSFTVVAAWGYKILSYKGLL